MAKLAITKLNKKSNTIQATVDLDYSNTSNHYGTMFCPECKVTDLAAFQIRCHCINYVDNYAQKGSTIISIKFKKSYEGDLIYAVFIKESPVITKMLTCNDTWHVIYETNMKKVTLDITVRMDIAPSPTPFAPLHEDTSLTDLELRGDDGSVWVHRAVLAAVSPVLRTEFSSLSAGEVKEDHIDGEVKEDHIDGEVKKDHIDSEVKEDHIDGEVKEDHIDGEVKEDHIDGEVKEDHIDGEVKEDHIDGEVKKDHIDSEVKKYHIDGEVKEDHIDGEVKEDHIDGEVKEDHIDGEVKKDHIDSEVKKYHIDMSEYSSATLQLFKDYVYKNDLTVDFDELLCLASFYEMPELELKCIHRIILNLNARNFCSMLILALNEKNTKLLLALLECIELGGLTVDQISKHVTLD